VPSFVRGVRAFSWCSLKKHTSRKTHEQQQKYPYSFSFLVLLVNDSEYSKSTGAKPIFRSLLAVFISFGARCCCCGSCGFLLLLLRAPTLVLCALA
jgi:hypothetical protein